MANENNLWGIHAGKTGDASSLFTKQDCVAVGWVDMGDLSQISPDREAFKQKVSQVYPTIKPGAIPNYAGQLFRFIHEMQIGDLIAYPDKFERKIYLGEVTGAYVYDPNKSSDYPNMRSVKWLGSFPRTQFSQGALYEVGSAMSFFQVKNFAEEFRAVLDGKPVTVSPVEQDETVALVSGEIEDTTRDFILKRLSQEFKGLPLEGFVVHLFEAMGYHARQTMRNEPSVDVIAHKDHLGIEPPIIKIQVKSSEGTASDKDVSALCGKLGNGEAGVFITLGGFSSHARDQEKNRPNLRLIDGDELVDLILQHYDRFDAKHKGVLPLRRVYVPEALD